ASVPGRPARAAGAAPGSQTGSTEASDGISNPEGSPPGLPDAMKEAGTHAIRAEAGDPSSARRVAELLELAGHDAVAAIWWGRAAQLGEPDAVDYVEGVLTRDSSPSMEILLEGSPTGPDPQELFRSVLDSYGTVAVTPSRQRGAAFAKSRNHDGRGNSNPEEGDESLTSWYEKGRR